MNIGNEDRSLCINVMQKYRVHVTRKTARLFNTYVSIMLETEN